jgi:hypothetical protein
VARSDPKTASIARDWARRRENEISEAQAERDDRERREGAINQTRLERAPRFGEPEDHVAVGAQARRSEARKPVFLQAPRRDDR